MAKAGAVIALSSAVSDVHARAAVVLPVTNVSEEEGTFTNLRGRVQRFLQAKAPPGMARPTWWAVTDLLGAMGDKGAYWVASDVFAALAAARPELGGMSYDTLGLKGQTLAGAAQAAGVGDR